MKLIIPEYLKNIKIIDQMYNMLTEFEDNYSETSTSDSFDDYLEDFGKDPVGYFLTLMLPIDSMVNVYKDEDIREEEYENKMNFLRSLFYSVKGTFKVLDYLRLYNIFGDAKVTISYTTKNIKIEIEHIDIPVNQFYSAFEDFLTNLLYFEKLVIKIDKFNSSIEINNKSAMTTGTLFYKRYEI